MHHDEGRPAAEAGFTMVEVVVAVAVLTIVTAVALLVVTPATRVGRNTPVLTAAADVADRALEAARATSCSQLPWQSPSTVLTVPGVDPARWKVTGTAMPLVYSAQDRRNRPYGTTTRADSCAGTAAYQFATTVTSVARPSLSVSLTTSIYQGTVQP